MTFVVFEGIDGCGKSTQAVRLATWLRESGVEVVATREPTDGKWGRQCRAWLRGDAEGGPADVLELFIRDRAEHVRTVVEPALARGAFVICDRYLYSTLAYQAAQGLPRAEVRARADSAELPVPDAVIWLRLPVERALARLGLDRERFEREAFLVEVDREYAALGLEAVDAGGAADAVERAVRDRLRALVPE